MDNIEIIIRTLKFEEWLIPLFDSGTKWATFSKDWMISFIGGSRIITTNVVQPTSWRDSESEIDRPKRSSPREKNAWSLHQRLFEGNVKKKNQKEVWEFWKEGFRSCLHIGKVLAPHAPVTRMKTFNRVCKNVTSILFIFPFYIFFIFLGVDQCCLTLMYPQVRWGIQTYVVL